MVNAFVNHGTPDILPEDIDYTNTLFDKAIPTPPASLIGFFTAPNGRMYSWHFWLYPLTVASVQKAMPFLGLDPCRSFVTTNALLYVVMLWVILLAYPNKGREKYFLLLLSMFGPATAYISWPHTELFSAALFTMALVFYFRKNLFWAALFSAVAACQNNPIALFTAWCGIVYFIHTIKTYRAERTFCFRNLALMGLCGSPVLFSPIFYKLNFGVFNLIKASGTASFSYISAERMFGFWMDLSTGMVLSALLPVALFFYLIIRNLIKRVFRGFSLVVLTMLMLLVSCSTFDWYSGYAGSMRYSAWIFPLVIFYIAQHIDWKKSRSAVLLWLCVITTATQLAPTLLGMKRGHFQMNMLPEMVLRHAPALYNPEKSIFMALGLKNMPSGTPVVFIDGQCNIRKILLTYDDVDTLKEKFWVSPEFDSHAKKLSKKPKKEQYVNMPKGMIACKGIPLLPEVLLKFSELDISENSTGFSSQEPGGRWTDAQTACIVFKMPTTGRNYVFDFTLFPFLFGSHNKISVKVKANEASVATWIFEAGKNNPSTTIFIPAHLIAPNGTVKFEFKINKPQSPKALHLSADPRKLGLRFVSLSIKEAPPPE